MTLTHGLRARFRLLCRRAAEERMNEEMAFHLDQETEKNVRRGMTREEARRRAVLAFGGSEGHKEAMRDGRTLAWADGLTLDLKLGIRMLIKHPGLTLIGGLAMAVAIAIGAGFYEVVNEVLNTSIPVEEGERVVAVRYEVDPGRAERRILHDFAEWREEVVSIEQLGAFRQVAQNLVRGARQPELVQVAEMTASGFALTRTPPVLGRYLVPEDERPAAPPVVVIGYDAWRSRFHGDPGIVGRPIQLGTEPHVVVGVMPEGYGFPFRHEFWTPLRSNPSDMERGKGPELLVFGRLAPGVTIEQAQAELSTIGRRAAAAHPETHGRLRLRVLPYTHDHLDGLEHPVVLRALTILRFLVGGLLAVVAVNLAVLVYARTVARRGEIAVRSALGASRRRILGQLFAEAFALSALGAIGGLVLARAVLAWGEARMSMIDDVPFWIDLDLSPGTVVYALVLAILAAGIMGILPGLKATGTGLYAHLREMGGGVRLGRAWTSLIVAQVAVAVAILPLAVYTVWRVARVEVAAIGFPAEEFLVGSLRLGEASDGGAGDRDDIDARTGARQQELAHRVTSEPGVSAVAFSSGIPGVDGTERRVEIESSAALPGAESTRAGPTRVGAGLFEAYDAEILAGRTFEAGDFGSAGNSVVVNRSFVKRFLGDRPALGHRLRYPTHPDSARRAEWHEIVGVVEDFPSVTFGLASADGVAKVYHPLGLGEIQPVTLHVRFEGGVAAGSIGRVREIAAGVDPELRVQLRPLEDFYGSLRSGARFAASGLALVTSSVLLLSGAGIYALMSFTVAQRTREIGIRTALGADRRRILASIFGRATRQLALGALVGSLMAGALFSIAGFPAQRVLALLALVAAIMLGVGLLAAAGPARRGLRIQPMEALRDAR